MNKPHLPLKGRILNTTSPKMNKTEKNIYHLHQLKWKKQYEEDKKEMKEIQQAHDFVASSYKQMGMEIAIGSMNSPQIVFTTRIKPKDKEHELYLIQFQEGTIMDEDRLNEVSTLRWHATAFVPVVGIEVKKKEEVKALMLIRQLNGYEADRKVDMFYDYSFLNI